MALDDSFDYDSAQAALDAQAARIKLLRAFKPIDSGLEAQDYRSAVTGATMIAPLRRKPLLSSLSPLIADTTASREEDELAAQRAALTQRQVQGMSDWFRSAPQDTPAIAPHMEYTSGEGYEGQPSSSALTSGAAAVPVSQADKMAYIAAGARNPMTRPLATEYAKNELITLPDKMQAQAATAHENELNRANTLEAARVKATNEAEQKRLDRLNRTENAQIMAGSRGASTAASLAGTYTFSHNTDDGKNGVYVNNRDPTKTSLGPAKEAPPKPVTGAEADKRVAIQGKLDTAHSLQNDVRNGVFSDNQAANYLSGAVGGYINMPSIGISPERHAASAKLEELKADINHGLYGASFSGGEQARAAKYQESAGSSPEAMARYVDHLVGMAERGVARRDALTNNPGARFDNATGAVILKDGSEVPGTRAPTDGTESTNPVSKPKGQALPKATAAASPAPTSTPAGTNAKGQSSLDINRQAYTVAKNAYARNPNPTTRQQLDLAWADLQRAQSDAGSNEATGMKAAVNTANAELGTPNVQSKADALLKKYK